MISSTSIVWMILGALHLITILWYFLIRKDVLGYLDTQVKLLGQENESLLNNFRLRLLLYLYALVLMILMLGSTFYLSFL